MPDAVICGYARTPFGKFRGALSSYSAVELGIKAVEELLSRTGIDPSLGQSIRFTWDRFCRLELVKPQQDKLLLVAGCPIPPRALQSTRSVDLA